MAQQFDFLIIGGGIAGLTYAMEVAPHGSVAVLFKRSVSESSTWYAQGGIAAVQSPSDSYELHTKDTLIAGADLCNEEIVKIVVEEGPARIAELIQRGAQFDTEVGSSTLHLTREGGHSERRVIHAQDATGYEVQRTLVAATNAHPNITFFPDSSAIDLITTRKLGIEPHKRNAVCGAYVLTEKNEVEIFFAKKVLVATGGAGKIYLYTTNPNVATGDGIAMCFRAGATVANLEFFQFHPTCLYHQSEQRYLISEAVRGEGGKLMRKDGTPFMERYDARKELAPRDIVARAIDNEMKLTGDEHVLLDISHRGEKFVKEHFPNIYEKCLSLGLDITSNPIPVVPAAHYCCGGVRSNAFGETDLENLFVAGECASTGLHGANRLASNSLLEGLVFGTRAAHRAVSTLNDRKQINSVPDWNSGNARDSDEEVVITQTWAEIRRFMWNYVGIVRSDKRLQRALSRSELLEQEIRDYYWNFRVTNELLELRNLSLVSNLLIHSAILRKESRGLHYNADYPSPRPEYQHDTLIHPAEYFHYRAGGHTFRG